MIHPLQTFSEVLLDFQWYIHSICFTVIVAVRVFRLRGFFELMGTAIILFIVAIGYAVNVEQLLLAPAGAISQSTTVGLKALSLAALVIYGSIAANLVVFAVTSEKREL